MTHCDHCGRQVPLSEGPHYTKSGLACIECFRALVRAAHVKRLLRGQARARRAA